MTSFVVPIIMTLIRLCTDDCEILFQRTSAKCRSFVGSRGKVLLFDQQFSTDRISIGVIVPNLYFSKFLPWKVVCDIFQRLWTYILSFMCFLVYQHNFTCFLLTLIVYGKILEILILLLATQLKGFPLFILSYELQDK